MPFRHKLLLFSILGALLLLANAVLPYMSLSRVSESAQEMERSREVIAQLERVVAQLTEAMSSERGYIITGREEHLGPYHAATRLLSRSLAELHGHAAYRPEWRTQVTAISDAVSDAMAFFASLLEVRRRSQSEAFAVIAGGKGEELFKQVSEVAIGLAGNEHSRVLEFRGETERRLRHAGQWLIWLTVLNLSVFGAGYAFVLYNLRTRENAEERSLALAAEREKSHAAMERALVESRAQQERLDLLARMSEALITARTTEEAYKLVERFVVQLLPQFGGTMSVLHPSRDLLEVVAHWNVGEVEHTFEPDSCHALRRGQPYRMENFIRDVACQHPPLDGSERPYLCVPMIAQGEVFGLLTLVSPEPISFNDEQMLIAFVEQLSLALANMRLRETLRRQSILDPLTGLHNRRFLEENLRREIVRASRRKYQLSLIMADIDHFKRINDTYGHDAGDAALRAVASELKAHVRECDLACRYGGEELVFVLAEASIEQAEKRAQRMRSAVQALRIKHGATTLEPITISFGIAAFPEHGLLGDALISAADEALYRAKSEGRNRVVLAHSRQLSTDSA